MYEEENFHTLNNVENALIAHHVLQRDKDYIVKDEVIQLVEATTGRVILNKRYPDTLHRAVEIKEGLKPAPLTTIFNSITMQNFLRQYKTLCGMTGTAATSAAEFESAYGLAVDVIGPNTPSIRTDLEDAFFIERDAYINAVLEQIRHCYSRKQPVLVGTRTVAESEMFSALLTDINIPHHVLNAKNDAEEAEIIALAGTIGRVTISTNMAGRGVDIRLGGCFPKENTGVAELGGLFILSTGINKSERIDNQLRGRAGRQGDPGSSKFFVWLGDEEISGRMTPLEKVKAELGNTKNASSVRKIQRTMEGEAAGARYSLNRFSAIVEEQRRGITVQRTQILKGELYLGFLEKANPDKFQQLIHTAGIAGVKRAEQQLTLHYINKHWAEYLGELESVRDGIHFRSLSSGSVSSVLGGNSAVLDEYTKIAINLRDEMLENIKKDVIEKMETLPITRDGIDMNENGLQGGTTTWTYAIDESAMQFNSLQAITKNIKNFFSGENGILTKHYRRKLAKKSNATSNASHS